MMESAKFWNYDKIINLFDNCHCQLHHAKLQTPLFTSVRRDTLVWKLEHDGMY
ncbi:unnamed protein product [Trifolium pratense]|uniref:Uncharacterized protein n=1 Tax=Trifolium pratense TaxID=57577 RepID=A0ACB0JV31_TRIPR|nr:unnamed protein product [Trifolium pratense]